VALWMLLLAVVARPMLLVFSEGKIFSQWFWIAWAAILVSAIAPSFVYAYARYSLGGRWSGLRTIPSMLILGCGMCVNNTLGVLRGLIGWGGEFVRTPKSGSADSTQAASASTARARIPSRTSYQVAINHTWIAEVVLGVYSLLSFLFYFNSSHRAFSIFLLLYSIGFLLIGWLSRPKKPKRAGITVEVAPLLTSKMSSVESAGATQ